MNNSYKNILVITSQAAGVGDMIMASPVFRVLRSHFKEVELTLMVNPVTAGIMENNPYFNEIIVYNRNVSLIKKLSFIRQMRSKNFDMVLCLSECLSTLLLCYLSGAKVKVGFNWQGRGIFLNIKVTYFKPENRYLPELFLDQLKALGLPDKDLDPRLEFCLSEKNRQFIKDFFRDNNLSENDSKRIVVHPGAGWKPRRWPAEKFSQLIEKIINEYNVKVFIIGSKDERQLAQQVIDGVKDNNKLYNCSGIFNLQQCAVLLESSDLFIGNDSAPLHLAAAVDTRIIALFGPGNADKCAPRTNKTIVIRTTAECAPCNQFQGKCVQDQPNCMNLINVEDVWDAAKKNLT